MGTRRYYTLIVRTPDQLWTPEFGDYVKRVVDDELRDTRHSWPKGTRFKVIATGDTQADVTEAVRLENDPVARLATAMYGEAK